MDANFVKVEGRSGWYKNTQTGTVINTNEDEIILARQHRDSSIKEQKVKLNMKSDISNLKDEVSELKALIKELIGTK